MDKAPKLEPSKGTEQDTQFTVTWDPLGGDVPTVYANNLFISHAGAEFYLVFGEVVPPLVLKGSEMPAEIPVRIVSRVAVTPEVMVAIGKLIADNLKSYNLKQQVQG